jgi:hypothetical protein
MSQQVEEVVVDTIETITSTDTASITALADTTADAQAPIATVSGKKLLELPPDLYIPPDAMHVLLEIISIFWTFQLQQSPSNMLHISS